MKRLVAAFGVPLILAIGLGQGDTRLTVIPPVAPSDGLTFSLDPLPGTLAQSTTPHAPVPSPRNTIRPNSASPYAQSPRTPGDVIPHVYVVYGLRTGPGGMAFTDKNGAAIPVPSNPNIYMGPFNGLPVLPPLAQPPTYTFPRTFTFPRTLPLPAPNK